MTTAPSPALARRPDDVTPAWLTAVLGGSDLLEIGEAAHSLSAEPVGTGQMGDTFRITFRSGTGASPSRSVIAKFASTDERSRSTGLMTRAYEIEVGFYGQVADRLRARIPRCYHRQCDTDTGWFVLLLEDLIDASQGDQLAGCGVEVATASLVELARLHGPAWERADLAEVEWLQRGGPEADAFLAGVVTSLWPGFVERYEDRVDPDHLALGDRFISVLGPWLDDRPPGTTVTHGDFRLDNLLFRPGETRPYLVDWQTAAWGPAASDVVYFLGGSLTVEDRRRHGSTLLDGYHRALEAEGVRGLSRDRLELECRRLCFGGLVMTIGASMLVKRTDRGDEMFVTSLARYAQQALDLDAEATLPVRRDP
jgi:Ecdysteroid kinase-like family